ncbi:MAG: multidrug resistance protein D [Firmicutes bacterium ADurb.Bin467]|nr:MAG: multidrug resistance protein D [Firmicutes bacterium ADurb.Bin467]
MKSRQTTQNWLYCTLVGVLGLYASTYDAMVDRMTARFLLDARMIGILMSVYAAGSLTSVLLSGMLSDSIGKRRVVLSGGAVLTLGVSLVATAGSVPLLMAGLFLAGMGFGPCESIGSALLTDENPGGETRWMNISQIFFGAGAIAAPVAAVWYASLPGRSYSSALFVCAGAVFLCWLAILSTSRGRLSKPEGVKRELNLFGVLKNREFLLYAVMVCVYLCYEALAPAYFKQLFLLRGASEQTAGLAISIFWAAMIVFRFVGVFMDGKELFCIRWFTPMIILGVAVLLLAKSDGVRLIGAALFGFGCGPVWPMLYVLAARLFPDRSGAAFAMMMLFTMAGKTASPALFGTLVNNVPVTIGLCAALAALLTGCAWYASKRYAPGASALAAR